MSTVLIALIVLLWCMGGFAVFLLMSFGMGDDHLFDRIGVAVVWPIAAIYLAVLFAVEAIKYALERKP